MWAVMRISRWRLHFQNLGTKLPCLFSVCCTFLFHFTCTLLSSVHSSVRRRRTCQTHPQHVDHRWQCDCFRNRHDQLPFHLLQKWRQQSWGTPWTCSTASDTWKRLKPGLRAHTLLTRMHGYLANAAIIVKFSLIAVSFSLNNCTSSSSQFCFATRLSFFIPRFYACYLSEFAKNSNAPFGNLNWCQPARLATLLHFPIAGPRNWLKFLLNQLFQHTPALPNKSGLFSLTNSFERMSKFHSQDQRCHLARLRERLTFSPDDEDTGPSPTWWPVVCSPMEIQCRAAQKSMDLTKSTWAQEHATPRYAVGSVTAEFEVRHRWRTTTFFSGR